MHRSRERSGKEIILTRSDSTPSKNIMSALMTMKGKSGLQHPISVNLTKYVRKSCSSFRRREGGRSGWGVRMGGVKRGAFNADGHHDQ
jgi:hypothetical protein